MALAVFLALITNRADVVLRVRVLRIDFDGPLVTLQRQTQRLLLVQRDAQLIEVHGISRILIRELLEQSCSLAKLFPDQVQIAHLLVGSVADARRSLGLRRGHLRYTGCHHHRSSCFECLSCGGNRQT